MTRHSSRRDLLKGAALLSAVPVAALGGVPVFDVTGAPEFVSPETPIVRLFRQWEAIEVARSAAAVAAEPEGFLAVDEACAAFDLERHRVEDAIRDEAPTDLRDFAIKVLILSGEGTWALPDQFTLECAALAGRDFDKLPRCLFESDHQA